MSGFAGLAVAAGGKLVGLASGAVGAVSKMSPRQLMISAAAVAVVAFGVWHHFHSKHVLKAQWDGGYAQAKKDDLAQLAKLEAHAEQVARKTEQMGLKVSRKLGEEHNAKINAVGNLAADIMRGGPGKAACLSINYPRPGSLSDGQVTLAGSGGAAVDPVPDQGRPALIAVPLNDLVRMAGQCDINRDEAAKARLNDDQQNAIWQKFKQQLEKH